MAGGLDNPAVKGTLVALFLVSLSAMVGYAWYGQSGGWQPSAKVVAERQEAMKPKPLVLEETTVAEASARSSAEAVLARIIEHYEACRLRQVVGEAQVFLSHYPGHPRVSDVRNYLTAAELRLGKDDLSRNFRARGQNAPSIAPCVPTGVRAPVQGT